MSSGVGLSINSFYAGGFLHADDIRTLVSSVTSLEKQFDLVNVFAKEHLLKLNVTKCEIVVFANQQCSVDNQPMCPVDGAVVPAGDVGKCLGYWWKRDPPRQLTRTSLKLNGRSSILVVSVFSVGISDLCHQDLCWTRVMPTLPLVQRIASSQTAF